jgi:hypothetical protein
MCTVGHPYSAYGGILSDNPAVNPEFASANHVMLRHCDGNSFMSNLDAPVVHASGRTSYLRGHHILRAIVHELATLHGMQNVSLAVLGGSSSGGFGVFGVVDEFADMVRGYNPNAEVVGVPDGGFWADLSAQKPSTSSAALGPMQKSWSAQQINATVPKACREVFTGAEAWKCLLPQYSLEYISTPLFVVQPGVDFEQSSWGSFWGISCSRSRPINWETCSAADLSLLYTFEHSFKTLVESSLARRVANPALRTGYFIPACSLHIQTVSYCDRDHPNCIGWHTHTIAQVRGCIPTTFPVHVAVGVA